MSLPEKQLKQYDLILSKIPFVERKGKTSPYTSVGGHMFTMMRKDGVVGMRLSKEEQNIFFERHDAEPFENYGSMIKDYVTVPEDVLMDTALMTAYVIKSYEYTKTLPKKPSKSSKKSPTPKKVTHEVGMYYKSGQVKSEIIDDLLINYYEDGSIKAKGYLLKEQMEGRWLFYRKGGVLWQIGHFHKDVKEGEWIRYDSKGEIAYHVVFKNGKIEEKLY